MNQRQAIREAVFASAKSARKVEVEFFGEMIEVRQPSVGRIIAMQSKDERLQGIVGLLVEYCVVPHTDEPVFDAEDAMALMEMPFNEDFVRLSQAIESLTKAEVDEEVKN